ncbi:hypothetical protein [Maricaulis sp.]|uniref:hypothetical protein n=1 Tax=Maricaulis sp. TaxID=1486257 RepID=UPI002624FE3D|nr:hypothetical protein [Maricaulis sp.]
MGEVLFAPLDEPWPRRVFAGALAVMANALLLALILLAPRHMLDPVEPDVVEVILVERPVETEEPPAEVRPVQDIPVEQEAEPETADNAPERPPQAPEQVAPAESQARGETIPEDEDEDEIEQSRGGGGGFLAFEGDALSLPAGRGSTPMFLREVFCQSSSAATREAAACPDGPPEGGWAYSDHGTAEQLARVRAAYGIGLTAEEIRALFADRPIPARDLAGLGTTTNQHSQATSAADSMRDSLPPLVPDPAFGD